MPKAPVSSAKAKKILHEGKANGKDLTTKQKKFFGRIAGGAKTVNKAAEGTAVTTAKDNILEGMKEGGGNWIQGAIKHPGALTKQAKAAGMSTQEFAQKHKGDKGTTGKRARLAITLKKLPNAQDGAAAKTVALANTINSLEPNARQKAINSLAGMQDGGVATPTDILEGRKGTKTSTLVEDKGTIPMKSSARQNIIEGMQLGGGMAPQGGVRVPPANEQFMAMAQMLNAVQDPLERQQRIDAMMLGLQSARKLSKKAGFQSVLPEYLIPEVTRAYEAIRAGTSGAGRPPAMPNPIAGVLQ